MRRVFLVGCALVILLSCARREILPAEEVLKRAARAGQDLNSARYELEANVTIDREQTHLNLTLNLDGILQDGGRQTQFAMTLGGKLREGEQEFDLRGQADIIAVWGQEVFLNISSLEVTPAHPLFKEELVEKLRGQWWRLPAAEQARETVTPDPRLLQVQSQVVSVTRDHGLQSLDGEEVYHYDATLDQEKLLVFLREVAAQKGTAFDEAATRTPLSRIRADGELQIDADTFVIRRLRWEIAPSGEQRTLTAAFALRMYDHNVAPSITPPAAYQDLSPTALFQAGETTPLVPDVLPLGQEGLPEIFDDELLFDEERVP